MSKSILGLILSLFLSLQTRAEQPTFNISSFDATPGEIIDVDFNVDNFIDLISVQFSVNWDHTVLQFRTIKNFNSSVPGLSPSVFGATPAMTDNGFFTLGWIESSITQITIPNGSLFFTVEFEVIGSPCESSPVEITNTPLEIEVAEADENIGLIANNGEINIPGTGCAQTVSFIGNSVIGACGSNACVQFTVENFITVGSIEFSVLYNPAVLQFDEIKNFAPLPGFNSSGSTNLFAPGVLRVLWFNGNAENDTLPDGTVLFEICFDVIGTGGQSSEITFSPTLPNTDLNMTISDIDGNFYPVDMTPAVITAQCQLEGFALIADTICTMPGEPVCFEIKVNDFDDIIAMQFTIKWDSTVFEFDNVGCFGIPGLDATGFGVPGTGDVKDGELWVSWLDLSLQGVTVPDFSTIFCLCLNAVGNAGTSTPITFTDDPLTIDILNAQDSLLEFGLLHGRGEIKLDCDPVTCALSYTLNTLNPNCAGEQNGVLNLTVIENCPETPTYAWNTTPVTTTQDLTGVGAGIYTVTITLGTTVVIVTDTLFDPAPWTVDASIINPNPPGSATGAVNILTVTGGTPPYTYQWNTNPVQTTQDIANLLPGTYTVTITDNNGCIFTPEPYNVGAEIAVAITPVSCNGGSNGAINLSVSFGTGPYTYSWNTVPVSTTEDISNLTARQYCVTITDSGGSSRDTCFTVTQPPALLVTATITHDINENCQGAIDLNVTGGTMPYSYVWNTTPVQTSQDLTQLCGGQYFVTVTDGNGCIVDTCFTVFTGEFISVNLIPIQYGSFETSCSNICDGEITSVVSGGVEPFTYHWSNGATTSDISNLCAGTYTLTVTDNTGASTVATIVLDSPPPIIVSFIKTNPSDYVTSDGAISAVPNGGTPPYTFQWTGPVTGNGSALNNVPAGTYTLEITDANGCEFRDSEQLLPEVDVPCYTGMTVFTPNSDGRNDYFIITCVLDLENHLYIYNRYGGLVYETDDYQNTWIGVDQDNEPLPDGGYLWVLELFRPDGSTELVKGTVNLLRTAD